MRCNKIVTLHWSRTETTLWLTPHIRNLASVPFGQVAVKDGCGVKHGYNGWKYDIIKEWDITTKWHFIDQEEKQQFDLQLIFVTRLVSQVEMSQYAPPVPYDVQSLTAEYLLSFVMIDLQPVGLLVEGPQFLIPLGQTGFLVALGGFGCLVVPLPPLP
jgi:hypothetical protein